MIMLSERRMPVLSERRAGRCAGRRDEGFSLIELLVVMIIIGILAAIAIHIYLSQKQRSYDAQAKEDMHNAEIAEESYNTDFQTYAASPTSTTPPALLGAQGFKMSSKTQDITVYNYPIGATSGGSTTTSQPGGYCIAITSGSGKVYTFASFSGGLGTTPCP
jgi:type IV pilus assembly protein PilA